MKFCAPASRAVYALALDGMRPPATDSSKMEAPFQATVKVFLDGAKNVEAVLVESAGDDGFLPFLVAVALDKLLADLVNDEATRLDLFYMLRGKIDIALAEEGPATFGMPLVVTADRCPDVTMTVAMRASLKRRRFGATSTSRPYFRTPLPYSTLAEVTLYSLWDWSLASIESPEDQELMLSILVQQCDYYEAHGLPKVRDAGRAVFYAVMSAMS